MTLADIDPLAGLASVQSADTKMLAAALVYAENRFRVFPCVAGTKQPATLHGCLDATSDLAQIEKWWIAWPRHNIAVSTDGLLVVDVDPVNGMPNLWWTLDRADEFAGCPMSLTPRGGRHIWLRAPAGSNLRNTVGKIVDGITHGVALHVDTRANGGYVLVPPSIVDGRPYVWVPGSDLV
jgi:hypothetical protein